MKRFRRDNVRTERNARRTNRRGKTAVGITTVSFLLLAGTAAAKGGQDEGEVEWLKKTIGKIWKESQEAFSGLDKIEKTERMAGLTRGRFFNLIGFGITVKIMEVRKETVIADITIPLRSGIDMFKPKEDVNEQDSQDMLDLEEILKAGARTPFYSLTIKGFELNKKYVQDLANLNWHGELEEFFTIFIKRYDEYLSTVGKIMGGILRGLGVADASILIEGSQEGFVFPGSTIKMIRMNEGEIIVKVKDWEGNWKEMIFDREIRMKKKIFMKESLSVGIIDSPMTLGVVGKKDGTVVFCAVPSDGTVNVKME